MKDKNKTKEQLINELAEMRQREEKYRSVFGHAGLAIVVYDTNEIVQLWNNETEKLTGYKAEEVVGREVPKISLETPEQRREVLRQVQEKGYVENYETSLIRKDGTKVPVEITLAALRDSEGKITAINFIGRDITGRKKLEREKYEARDELARAEEKYRSVFEHAGLAIGVYDTNKIVQLWNKELEKISGYKAEEVVGREMPQISLDSPEQQEEVLRQVQEKGYVENYEFSVLRKDGTRVPVETTLAALRDSEGKITAINFIGRDITERKRLEQEKEEARDELARSEEKYRSVFEHAGLAIVVFDINGIVQLWNKELERVTGYKAEEMVGRETPKLTTETPEQRRELLRQAYEKGYTGNYETIAIKKDGTKVPVEVSLAALRDSEGKITAISLVGSDITERKRLEQEKDKARDELTRSEEKYRSVFEHAGLAIGVFDTNGIIQLCNKETERITGYKAEELVGKGLLNNMSLETSQQTSEVLRQIQEKGYVESQKTSVLMAEISRQIQEKGYAESQEASVKRKDGTELPIEVTLAALRNSQGKITAINFICRDITERKRLEREREEIRKELARSEEKYRSVFEYAGLAIVVYDANEIVQLWNKETERLTGYKAEEMIGRKIPQMSIETPEQRKELLKQVHQRGYVESHETSMMRKDGTKVPVEITLAALRDIKGEIVAFSLICEDITARKRLEREREEALEKLVREEETRRSNEKLSTLVNRLEAQNFLNNVLSEMRNLLEVCSSVKETAPIISSSARKLFPETQGALFLMNESRSDLESVTRWGDFSEDVDNNFFVPGDCWGLRRGRVHIVGKAEDSPICAHVRQIPAGGYMCLPLTARGNLIGLLHLRKARLTTEQATQSLSSMSDMAIIFSEQLSLAISNVKLTESLSRQSIQDPLSGLFNRRYMEESLGREIARAKRMQAQIGVVMADLDHLKVFNDTYGHTAGDLVIAQVGQVLKQKIRGSDIACRYGGEEFVIILPESSPEDTYKRADELREEMKRMELISQGQLLSSVTVSMGIATYPENGATADDLLRAADAALYKAKETGRDKVVAASQV